FGPLVTIELHTLLQGCGSVCCQYFAVPAVNHFFFVYLLEYVGDDFSCAVVVAISSNPSYAVPCGSSDGPAHLIVINAICPSHRKLATTSVPFCLSLCFL
ncbi:hypothetical protein B9Z19DRAFT_893901, partial [Tuber borchii]